MTYHDNDVVLSGKNGVTIKSGGEFTVSDFSITNGQDPNGKNKKGDIHKLSNSSKFTFTVGRKASSGVANWFNSQIPGERTTFNHTAGELNFAFVGNLKLTVSGGGMGSNERQIIFNDVAFAQGHSGASNNWWFGGKTAQHTYDSDGVESVICFGYATDNNQEVFGSFRRGGSGNGVNEVDLLACAAVRPARSQGMKISDVVSQYSNIPDNGNSESISGLSDLYDKGINHIQGYTQYENDKLYFILTHSVLTADYAHIVAATKSSGGKGYATYGKDWDHPGGIQTLGDYLLVPSEKDNKSQISMYDLRGLAVNELPRIENFILNCKHNAGCLGITNYNDKGVERYIMVIGDDNNYHIYIRQTPKISPCLMQHLRKPPRYPI
jgi:hypothetical protein